MNRINQENYNLLVNSEKIVKRLNTKNIFFNLDNILTKLYLDQLRVEFTMNEIIIMKKTLENDISASTSRQSIFISVFSVLVVLITTIFSYTANSGGLQNYLITILMVYIIMVLIYHFLNQVINERKIKLLNHLNLIIALNEQELNN